MLERKSPGNASITCAKVVNRRGTGAAIAGAVDTDDWACCDAAGAATVDLDAAVDPNPRRADAMDVAVTEECCTEAGILRDRFALRAMSVAGVCQQRE